MHSGSDVHSSKQRITESIPGERVIWHVLDGYLGFVDDKTEWTGTDIAFEISRKGEMTELRFTHIGLVPVNECFESCSGAWSFYMNSLRDLIVAGEGRPNESS